MKLRPTALIALAALSCVLIAPSASDQYGATAYRQLKFLLTDLSCSAPGTCDLASGTTIGGAAIGGGSGGTELNQSVGETDLRYDSTQDAYYYDADGDATHDTDGTEDYLDMLTVEVPSDHANVQAALDSNDCKKGSTTPNQGCRIRVAHGTYAEVFEIGGTVLADTQYSVAIEGAGPAGQENSIGGQTCSVTFTGNDTVGHSIIKVDGAIGWSIRNICVDMDESATNDALYGVAIGLNGSLPVKHGRMENVTIEDGVVANNVGMIVGNGASADIAFNSFRDMNFQNVGTCVVISSDQAVDQEFNGIECNQPTGTIGGVSFTSAGGETILRNFYMTPGAANQIGINIRNEALGALLIERPTFEWDDDDGTFINFDATGNTGAYRSTTITGGRFQVQDVPTTRHVCIDWNRAGTLNLIGNSFESNNASRTCEIDANNPHASAASDVNLIGNDTQWANTRTDMVVNESTTGGPMRVNRIEQGLFRIGQGTSIVMEGSSLDAFETTISPTNPTSDRTVTIPDANSTTVQAQTCGGTDKVSAISSAGVVTCSADSGGSGGGYAEIAAAALAGF